MRTSLTDPSSRKCQNTSYPFLILHPQKHRNIHTLGDLRVGGLEGGSSRNDLDQLASDDGLPGPVEGDSQLVDHLAGVLWRVVHSGHSWALFRASSLLRKERTWSQLSCDNNSNLHGIVDKRCKAELQVGLDHIGVNRVISSDLLSSHHGLWGEKTAYVVLIQLYFDIFCFLPWEKRGMAVVS